MTISNHPLVPGEPVKFIVKGFPEETGLRASIERFYAIKTDADRRFLIFNAFEEQIFSGLAGDDGKIASLDYTPRPIKNFPGSGKTDTK